MQVTLNEHERLDEVNEHLSLIQRTDGLVFGTDALLLAAYIDRSFARVAEFGTGCGIVSLLLLRRDKAKEICAIEVQEAYARLAERNAALNGLSERMRVIHGDVREQAQTQAEVFDLVVANPPYMKADSGQMCKNEEKSVARHELNGTIGEWCHAAARAVRYGGYFAVVYRPDRLTDLLVALREADLEPKRITFVQADANQAASMVLILAKRGASGGAVLTRPLLLHTDPLHTKCSEDMEYILSAGRFPDTFFGTQTKRKD